MKHATLMNVLDTLSELSEDVVSLIFGQLVNTALFEVADQVPAFHELRHDVGLIFNSKLFE